MNFVKWLTVNAAGLAVASWFFDGIGFAGDSTPDKLVPLLIVAAILGVINAWVTPVVRFLSLPFIVLTVGLFLLVINALMLRLTGWVADIFDIGFYVNSFGAAFGGAIVITIVGWFVNIALRSED